MHTHTHSYTYNYVMAMYVKSHVLYYCSVNDSGWSTEGVTLDFSNGSHVRCLSTHLTTFAILVNLHGNDVRFTQMHDIKIIVWITGHFRCRTGYPLNIFICWLWCFTGLSCSYYHHTSDIFVSTYIQW